MLFHSKGLGGGQRAKHILKAQDKTHGRMMRIIEEDWQEKIKQSTKENYGRTSNKNSDSKHHVRFSLDPVLIPDV